MLIDCGTSPGSAIYDTDRGLVRLYMPAALAHKRSIGTAVTDIGAETRALLRLFHARLAGVLVIAHMRRTHASA